MLDWLFGKKKQETKTTQKPKKKKSKAQQQTEDKWMYDFLVQFLNSPLWRVSLLDFVDQNCVVFDNEEQNKFQYTKIHNQFKSLVASLFDGMMQQVGLDQDKLVQLLEQGFQSKQKKLFNQLLLCDDFLKFKQLMVRRNRTLEEEALKAMQGSQAPHRKSRIDKQRDLVHESMKFEQQRQKKLQQQEQQMLRKALQMSQREANERTAISKLQQKTQNMEDAQIERKRAEQQKQLAEKKRLEQQKKAREQMAITKKQEQSEKSEQEAKKLRDQERKKQLRAKLNRKKNLQPISDEKTQKDSSHLNDLPPLRGTQKQQLIQEKKQEFQEKPIEKQQPKQQPKKQELKVESQEDRKKRLLQQREKIRKKKQQERKKMLEQTEAPQKTMNIVLQEEGIHDSVRPEAEKQAQQKVPKDEIERRKALMKKIKSRIVDDF